tara:strand:+ start:521 stop:2284 length:1764 start_codon:yes stop_codon:yes gene_type:complete
MEEKEIIELIRKLQADPILYFNTCLKIQNFGTGELIPFELNEVQGIMHSMMQRQLEEHQHVRMIVLKARRFGISTYVQGRYFRHAAMNRNKVVQITTHSKAATDVMFAMTRTMEQNLPKEVKPQLKYSGRRDLHWGSEDGGLNSSYSLSTVGGREVRGSKIDYLHCSEVASWTAGGEDYLLGLLNCVVQGFETEAVIESTAQGVGGVFHDMYWDAAEGNSGWESVFFPWYIYSHYRKPFNSEEEKEKFKSELGQDKRYGGESEQSLLGISCEYDVGDEVKKFTLDLENLHWRRQCIKTQCQNDLRKFHQEFPTNAREAFVTTGRGVFDVDTIGKLVLESQRLQREYPSEGFHIPVQSWKEKGGEKYIIEAMDEGGLQVWERPIANKEYRIGADVSEGIDVGRDTDWSVAVVLNASTMDEVAMLRVKIDPDLFAWQLASLGKWYNNAKLLVERNNHGLVTLKFLSDVHLYPDIYSEKILDERSSRSARKLGFHTTVKSKPLIIDYLKELIREDEINIKSPKVLDELQTFVNFPNGKMAAQSGSHDDCVMALAIACFGCKMFPASPEWSKGVNRRYMRPELRFFQPSSL